MSRGSATPAVSNSFSSAQRLKSARKRQGRLSAPLVHPCKSTMWTTSLHTQRLWMCWLMGQDLTHTPSQAPGNARYDCCPPKIHFHCEAWEVNFLTICRGKYSFPLPLLLSVLGIRKQRSVHGDLLLLDSFSSKWLPSCCSESCNFIGKIWFPLAETAAAAPLPGQLTYRKDSLCTKAGSSFIPDTKELTDESVYYQPASYLFTIGWCPEWNDKNVLDQVTLQVVLSYPVCLLQ